MKKGIFTALLLTIILYSLYLVNDGSQIMSGKAMDDDPLAFFISSEKSGWVSLDLSIPDKLYNW